jgi:hypothetical protein
LCFFHQYVDPETLEVETSFAKIATHYIFRGWFIADFISIIPYELFGEGISIMKLIRLIRLVKLFELLSVARFDSLIEVVFTNIRNDKLITIYNLRYMFKIVRMIIVAAIVTFVIGCIWYIFCDKMAFSYPQNNFIKRYLLNNYTQIERLVITCYFALTTLTTVGYGDYVAQNNAERIFAIFIMLLGVAVFSYVMGSFTDLISNYEKKLGSRDRSADLHNWLSLLSKFSKNKHLDINLVKKIDSHFVYFWKHDRNYDLSKKDSYLSSLPKALKLKVMEFLWADIFNAFNNFFLYLGNNKDNYFKFYYNISFCLMPRHFAVDEIVYQPDEDIEEMYLITEGLCEIGYKLNSDSEVIYSKHIKENDWIGDFYILFNVRTKYYYKSAVDMRTFGIDKDDLIKHLQKYPDLFSKFKTKAYQRYKSWVKLPMENSINEHLKVLNEENANFKISKTEDKDILKNSKFTDSRLNKKTEEVKEVIHEIEKKFVRLDDDYINLSKYLFDSSLECEHNLVKINKDLADMHKRIENLNDKRNQIVDDENNFKEININ